MEVVGRFEVVPHSLARGISEASDLLTEKNSRSLRLEDTSSNLKKEVTSTKFSLLPS